MPAPNFATLYDFETQIEGAFKSVLEAQLGGLVTAVTATRDKTIADSPRVELELIIGTFLKQRRATAGPYREIPNAWEASLRVLVITSREIDGNLHGQIRGLTRFCLSAQANLIDSTNLPYLQIMEMVPDSGQPAIIDELQQDVTQMNYHIWFAVQNNAWPS